MKVKSCETWWIIFWTIMYVGLKKQLCDSAVSCNGRSHEPVGRWDRAGDWSSSSVEEIRVYLRLISDVRPQHAARIRERQTDRQRTVRLDSDSLHQPWPTTLVQSSAHPCRERVTGNSYTDDEQYTRSSCQRSLEWRRYRERTYCIQTLRTVCHEIMSALNTHRIHDMQLAYVTSHSNSAQHRTNSTTSTTFQCTEFTSVLWTFTVSKIHSVMQDT